MYEFVVVSCTDADWASGREIVRENWSFSFPPGITQTIERQEKVMNMMMMMGQFLRDGNNFPIGPFGEGKRCHLTVTVGRHERS